MKFYDWFSLYDEFGKETDLGEDKFYEMTACCGVDLYNKNRGNDSVLLLAQVAMEVPWKKDKKPSYRIHEAAAEMLADTDLNVPASYVRLPVKTVLFTLPEHHSIASLTDNSGWKLRAMLLTDEFDGYTCRNGRFIFPLISIGCSTAKPQFIALPLDIANEETTIKELVNECVTKTDVKAIDEYGVEFLSNVVSLIVGACLLASNPEKHVHREVLNKWQDRYDRGTEEEKEMLAAKSEKLGKRCWSIGKGILLPAKYKESRQADAVGKQLTKAHLRRGHFHIVRFGTGKQQSKVVWYMPLIVRPDLQLENTRVYKSRQTA